MDIDPVRLEFARSLAALDSLDIEWFEGSALDMPFEGSTFDVALCRLTLHFLPDEKRGLQEIQRVLKPGGRLVASVWCSVEHCPGYHAFSEAIAKKSGKEPAPMPPFSLGNAEQLRTLAESAGFKDLQVQHVIKISRFASANQFVDAPMRAPFNSCTRTPAPQ